MRMHDVEAARPKEPLDGPTKSRIHYRHRVGTIA